MKKHIPFVLLLVLLAFTQIAWAQGLTGSGTRDVELPCLPSHGEGDNAGAWCGEENSTQMVVLTSGTSWFSSNVEITLEDLQAALVEALPGATSIEIQSKTQSTTYNGTRWRGQLNALDVAGMFKITVANDCEISLTGTPINPAEHPISIPAGQVVWIGFPFSESMTPADVFAGFATNGDEVSSKSQSATCIGTSWRGQLNSLEPGKGYIYKSAATEDRTFVFPTSAK